MKDISKKFSLKKPSNLENIPLQQETITFRSKVFTELSNFKKVNFKENISKEQKYFLKKYISGKSNFLILECDKNVGAMIISKIDYDNLVKDYFDNNKDTYISCTGDPLNLTNEKINNTLHEAYLNKHISNKLYKCLKINFSSRNGSLRLLPKLHKDKFSTRPIINCIKHPTSKLCHFVDKILKPIVIKLFTVLKDSQELLQFLNDIKIRNNNSEMNLYSFDFESLYTKIEPIDAANKICDYLSSENLLKSDHIDITGFRIILILIFENNIFKYKDLFFLQKIGLPMGCICGPTVANLYLYTIEKSWISTYNPLVYKRFIDDIFYADENVLDIEAFKAHFGYLKLNGSFGKKVIFLDTILGFDKLTNKFTSDLYIKPTNTYSYLLTTSNHPNFIFENIPTSLFIRIRRICSSDIDYLHHSKNLSLQLMKRGYDCKKVQTKAREIGKINRLSLLPYKTKLNKYNNTGNIINCHLPFENSLKFLKKTFTDGFHKARYTFKSDKVMESNLRIFNTINTNIGAYLIHNFKINPPKNKKYCTRCNEQGCLTCFYMHENYFLNIDNYMFPVLSDSNCNSTGVIYIIFCEKCNVYYIGESERKANARLKEHIKSIYDFGFNLTKSISNLEKKSEVSNHFNKKGHFLEKHFKFIILQKDLIDKTLRKSIETDLINVFLKLKIKILNRKIPNMKYIKAFTFYNP